MRRAVPAVIATLIGLGALLTFKSSPGVPSGSAATQPIKHRATPPAGPPRGTATTAPQSTATPAPTAPTATAPRSSATRTVDGDPFDNRYGTVQVRVTLQGNRITDVAGLQMPVDR